VAARCLRSGSPARQPGSNVAASTAAATLRLQSTVRETVVVVDERVSKQTVPVGPGMGLDWCYMA
jgi:hypothetical protein